MLVLSRIDHFRREDTCRAVERREGLVELSHMTADGRQLFDDVNVVSRVGNIKSRLDACDTAADDQRALCDGAFACGQGRVELHLGNCGAGKDYRLCRSLGLVFMYP